MLIYTQWALICGLRHIRAYSGPAVPTRLVAPLGVHLVDVRAFPGSGQLLGGNPLDPVD